MADWDVDVLIVGGGPAGLTAFTQLRQMGVSTLLVERRDGTSKLPKAHYLNSRSMEIFGQLGIADAIYEAGAPQGNMASTALYTSLGGDDLNDRRLVYTWDAFGGGALQPAYDRTSGYKSGNLAQKHLEPLLRQHAERYGAERVMFRHEMVAVAQDDDGVTATVRGGDGEFEVRAKYLIAADGGNSVGPALGMRLVGEPPFVRVVGVHFAADLAPYVQDDTSLIRLIVRPDAQGQMVQGGLVAMGPKNWNRHSEEWHLNIVVPIGVDLGARDWDDEQALAQVRHILKIDDLRGTILRVSEWNIEGVLAERYRLGRVFFVGDAAHRHPPTTGLGLNSGAADSHNLTWKLAAVLAGLADDSLLDSYETERRPVAARNIDWALFTFTNHLAVQTGWGILPGAPVEANLAAFHSTLADTPSGAAQLARLREFLAIQRTEFQARDVEMGYVYEGSAAVVADGTPPPERDPLGLDYRQTTRPGARMPHAWLERDGYRVATHDLLPPGAFLLLAGSDGAAWADAAQALALDLNLDIHAYLIGPNAHLTDPTGAWQALRGHDDKGAVLVRPDGHILFRSPTTTEDPRTTLRNALRTTLGLPA
ncbi:FAD-dependent monooxygenase [Actinocorallia sp. A-T 12471]|uniref:FAD-dependent monooxygenase n=1 Tax=Actinocorallia sp. A-T 12471 TaxID=3089813 RepID=UPI0029CCF035|nr:FAD-dependent monooxygenase [Actinocorallia sp. A-T 12471]MDX6744115.1 FAD-dependent monooxygenase [Actinocorallia sp. A-T 12471]